MLFIEPFSSVAVAFGNCGNSPKVWSHRGTEKSIGRGMAVIGGKGKVEVVSCPLLNSKYNITQWRGNSDIKDLDQRHVFLLSLREDPCASDVIRLKFTNM